MIDFRQAQSEDLTDIVRLLADDPLGAKREDASLPINDNYQQAFTNILNDPNALLIVATESRLIIGVAQLNVLQYLTYQGGKRAQIEGVRIARSHRQRGIGQQLFKTLIDTAKKHRCHIVQLTTDKARPQALAFYRQLGFIDSHEGMKLTID